MKPVQHYEVHEGLFAGEYPGSFASEIAVWRLEELAGKGVRSFIDLTTPADRLDPYEPEFANPVFPAGELRRFSHEIPDMGIPASPKVMRAILDRIRQELAGGRACYVHCMAGIGRTGTVVGCWLREQGLSDREALEEVQRRYFHGMEKSAWHPTSPQTAAQTRYVRDWLV